MATEFVGIELQLLGAEGVKKALQDIDGLAKSLGGRKKIELGLQQVNRDLLQAQANLRAYKKDQEGLEKGSTAWKIAQGYIENTKDEIAELNATAKIARQTLREMGSSFSDTANAITSRVRQLGGSMQSLGNAMTRLTSPFTRIATGFVMGAGYKALNTLTDGLSKGFSRYDTMKKYPKIMEAFGYSAEQSKASIDRLDKSVRGLPTGLDEMVDMSQRFTATTGDIKKGTDLAIAANNAFLASMSTDVQRYQGMMQLQDVLGGKDMNAKEWNSLVSSMTPAIVKMGESLGYTNKNMDEWITAVRSGDVANEDFIKTLIKVGTEGGEVAKMAENSKDTWQAFFANVGNAASRLTAGTIEAFDEISRLVSGKDLNLFMSENVIGAIDKMKESVIEWVRAHPQEIIDFFNDLKRIDFAGFGRGLIEGFGELIGLLQKFSDLMGGRSLEGFGKGVVRTNMLGRIISIAGGLIRGLAPFFGHAGALGKMAVGGGLLGKIAKAIGIGKGLKGAEDVAEGAGALGKASGSLVKLAKNAGLLTATIAGISFGGFVTVRSFKTMLKDIREMAQEVSTMSADEWVNVAEVVAGMGVAITAFLGLAAIIGEAVGSLSGIASAPTVIGAAVMAIVGAFGDLIIAEVMASFKMFEQSTKYLKNGLKNIEDLGNINFNKKKVEDAIAAMKQIMEAFDSSYYEGGSAKEGGGGTTHAEWSANSTKFKNVTENIAEAVKSVKQMVAELKSLPSLSEKEITDATNKVKDIVDAMAEIGARFNLKFDTSPFLDFLTAGTTGISEGRTANASNIISNISSMISTIKQTVADLKGLEKLKVDLDTVKENITEIGTKMGEIFQALNGAFGNTVNVDQDIEGVGKIKGSYNEGVTKDQTKKASNLKALFDSYKGIISSIKSIYSEIMGKEGEMTFDVTAFQDVMSKIAGDDGILAQLKSMYDQLLSETDGFGGETDVDLEGVMQGFSNAITSLKGAVTTLSEMGEISFDGEGGIGGIISSIKGMIEQLKTAFSTDAVAGLTEQINAFKEAINTALQSIKDMSEEIAVDVTVKLSEGFASSVKAVIDEINEAKKSIKATNEAISFSIPVSVHFSVSTNFGSAIRSIRSQRAQLSASGGGGWAKGGMIYRAGGGVIPFKRRGTDTVPAMLSPGEYVHNKRAVNLFGIDFMRKVNNLDMRGAMNELLARAGHLANVGNGTVVNNTYNNNQKVVQNINTNSPDFAFRSASRFAGAF